MAVLVNEKGGESSGSLYSVLDILPCTRSLNP